LRSCSAHRSFSHCPQGVRSSTIFLFSARYASASHERAQMQLRTTVFLRLDFSQPIQMVSLSVSAAAVSRCTCSGEGAMQPLRQAETHSPQSVQGSQSLTRFGRVNISSP